MKYIAFLRAINVGGHVVKMELLTKLLTELELKKVTSVLASGNLVFESRIKNASQLEKKMASHLLKQLGYEVETFIRTVDECRELLTALPFLKVGDDKSRTNYIALLKTDLTKAQEMTLESLISPTDDLKKGPRSIYWLSKKNLGESKMGNSLLEKKLNLKTTIRNANTLEKILVVCDKLE